MGRCQSKIESDLGKPSVKTIVFCQTMQGRRKKSINLLFKMLFKQKCSGYIFFDESQKHCAVFQLHLAHRAAFNGSLVVFRLVWQQCTSWGFGSVWSVLRRALAAVQSALSRAAMHVIVLPHLVCRHLSTLLSSAAVTMVIFPPSLIQVLQDPCQEWRLDKRTLLLQGSLTQMIKMDSHVACLFRLNHTINSEASLDSPCCCCWVLSNRLSNKVTSFATNRQEQMIL